jgi:hypothetical protein
MDATMKKERADNEAYFKRQKEQEDYQQRQMQRLKDERPKYRVNMDNSQRDEEYAELQKETAAANKKKAAYDADQKKLQEFHAKRQADIVKAGGATPKKPAVPSDIADQLQTQKNEKAYQNYESNRSLGDTFKKGGSVKMSKGSSASKRADGCAVRGKTRA